MENEPQRQLEREAVQLSTRLTPIVSEYLDDWAVFGVRAGTTQAMLIHSIRDEAAVRRFEDEVLIIAHTIAVRRALHGK